jgi:hypothetical protein
VTAAVGEAVRGAPVQAAQHLQAAGEAAYGHHAEPDKAARRGACRRTGSSPEPGTPIVQRPGRVALGSAATPAAPATHVGYSR